MCFAVQSAKGRPTRFASMPIKSPLLFSRFYHDSHVLSEQDLQKRGDWVALMALTKRILELHLKVLGIEPVDHM